MIKLIVKEARPATLVVSLISTTLGIVTAYKDGFIFNSLWWDMFRVMLLTAAGLLLQAGVNLINNYFEEDIEGDKSVKRNITCLGLKKSLEEIVCFRVGITFIVIAALIGVCLSYYSGLQLLVIDAVGILAAYFYSGIPLNYKRFGLGPVMSYIMMGPLMVYGAYFVFSKGFSWTPILYSLAVGLFIPAILVANEIRDYEEDCRKGVGTLTVRIGYEKGKRAYFGMIILAYISVLTLIWIGELPITTGIILSTLPLLKSIFLVFEKNKRRLIPLTARLYLVFSIEFIITLLIFGYIKFS